MKTQEQVEAALKKYEQMLEEFNHTKDFAEEFLKGEEFYKDKEAYVVTAVRYFNTTMNARACEKLIKNCKWILDIE